MNKVKSAGEYLIDTLAESNMSEMDIEIAVSVMKNHISFAQKYAEYYHKEMTKSNCEVKITSINNVCQHSNLERLQPDVNRCNDCGKMFNY